MKSEKKRSQFIFGGRAVSSFALSSTFLMSSLIGVSATFAASTRTDLVEDAIPESQETPVLLSQVTEGSILYFNTRDYTVNVFRRNNQVLMNVFDGANNIVRQREAPASLSVEGGDGVYISTGSFRGRQVRYKAFFNRQGDIRTARLVIVDSAEETNPIATQLATSIEAFRIEPDFFDDIGLKTILSFSTATYSVRVFTRGEGGRFMNVYNNFTGASEVNGQPASVLPKEAPYENAVSYIASGERSGQSVEYVARIDNSGGTSVEIFNVNSQRLFQESGIGPVTFDIPAVDSEGIDIGRVEAAFVAAVFGDDTILSNVQKLFPEAFMDSSRQGDFINAGAFQSEDAATIRVLELKANGFPNARVIFLDIRYR